jgi:hypothetical protein
MRKGATLKLKGLKIKGLQVKKRQPQNVRGQKQRSSDEKRGNPTMLLRLGNYINKSLVPCQELVDQHNNLKEVSSQSSRICVPMFNAARGGTIAHSRVGHQHINFMDR